MKVEVVIPKYAVPPREVAAWPVVHQPGEYPAGLCVLITTKNNEWEVVIPADALADVLAYLIRNPKVPR